MRFLITSGARNDSKSDAEAPPDEAVFLAYMKFNEDMAKAGVLIASEGLHPSIKGVRVEARGGTRAVVDGPFTESKELVGGFYLLEVPTLDDAIGWALRCPVGMGSADVLQIHPLTGEGDIPPEFLELIAKVAPTWSASFHKPK